MFYFILVIELLGQQVRNNKKFKGITVEDIEIKSIQFADVIVSKRYIGEHTVFFIFMHFTQIGGKLHAICNMQIASQTHFPQTYIKQA